MRLSLRPRPAALLLTATLTIALSPALPAAAADPTWTSAGHGATVTVRGVPGDGQHTFTPTVDRSDRRLTSGGVRKGRAARPYALSPTPLSDIDVNYDANFEANPAAKAAFEAAVAIWERAVYSTIPIEVDASMAADLGPGVLGFAGPIDFFNGGGVLYPVALANSLDESDLNGTGTSEIEATFTTSTSFFYFGTDGNTPVDKYDFESVVIHEIGHGLGFIGSVEQTGPQASYNDPPLVYDLFTETSDGAAILDYPNNSQALTDAVTSGAVYWAGPHGAGADRGRMPRLYAPTLFEPGSSYSHLSAESYPENDVDSLMAPGLYAGDAIHDPGEILLGMFRDMGWITPGLPGSTYTPIQPVRLLDTVTRLGAGATRDIAVTGANGVPANATAVVVNLTSAVPTGNNVLRSYALPRATSGAPIPPVSNLNTAKGDTRANLAVVPIGRSGRIRVLNTGSATRLVVDLAGFYAPAATSYFHPRTPVRIMDTRNGTGPVPVARVGPGQTVELTVAGLNDVPTGATAVVLTLTAVAPTNNTYVTAFPADGVAGTSNLNINRNATVANQVIVKLGAGGPLTEGKVLFRNNAGSTHLLADLTGWFDSDTGGALFRPALTQRLKDSRPGRLGAGAQSDVGVSELADVNSDGFADAFWGVPDTATAAIVNLTGVGASTPTYLQLYPAGTSVPTVSNLNLATGQTAAASATVLLGSGANGGEIRVRNNAGTVPFIVDLQGWYGPA